MADEMDDAIEGAWAYERLHVPAMFRWWAGPVLDAAGVGEGQDVLDVACGTGIVAREALGRVGPGGSVTGLDIGPGMLAVAAEREPRITWTEGDAQDLPFEDDRFDAVVNQFGLMFMPDPVRAIQEMFRCVTPGSRIAVAVWDALGSSGVYPMAVDLLDRRAGSDAADALRAPFVLGDTGELHALFTTAGAGWVSIETPVGTARFPSIRSMFEAELRGWLPVMGVFLDDEVIEELLDEAETLFRPYVTGTGEMAFETPAHIVTAST